MPFLQGMYRAGGKGSFDVLALHPYAPGSRDHWGLHTGLLREDGSAKPAMQALTDVTRAITSD